MASVCLKEETIYYKMIYYSLCLRQTIVRNRISYKVRIYTKK